MLRKAIKATFLLAVLAVFSSLAQAEVPDWVRSLARQKAKTYADDVNAVVLLDDHVTYVKDNGDLVKRGRHVVRILRPEGRQESAVFTVHYNGDSKVNYLRGWSITEKGQEYESKSGDVAELGVSSYEVYSDAKVKALRISGADVGTVVAFEYEQQAHPYVFQDSWQFQRSEPVEQSHYELHLASGWRFQSAWTNHKEEKPTEANGALEWTLSDVPRIENEPQRPPAQGLEGGVIFTFFNEKMPAKSYRNWSEFGSWYTQLAASMREPSPSLTQKVQELAPASLPLMQRIRALASFAQHDVRYVAIEVGVGGYRPHSASDIFNHRYGDCKDKATVLSAMLAQIGVKSYYVIVNASRGIVTKNSPPNIGGFNHMILAIALPDASYSKPLPALYNHPQLGRLLIFDPTNEFVPFGEIPHYEQDNYGLLVGEQGGDLIHLPLSTPESNGVTRTAKLKLLPDGTLQGQIEEKYTGYNAMLGRMFLQRETETDRRKFIERLAGRSLGAFQLDNYELLNDSDIDQDLIIRYTFSAPHYAKNAGAMLLVRPRVLGEMAGQWDANKPRHYAYEFRAPFLNRENVEITLPDGFKVDELPDPIKASFQFAEYASKTENSGNVLKYSREYRQLATEVPLDQMDQLKKLFGEINLDEKNMAVLKKTN
ncbi:MAG TPA: DUF3857 and transglutaminase domain-containing protein [Candidatus Limnocylindrales bacterium]|nr:DUF3857 and transglutaminase domain-containing protein [Candidatus Limnocylindrales bacterium]